MPLARTSWASDGPKGVPSSLGAITWPKVEKVEREKIVASRMISLIIGGPPTPNFLTSGLAWLGLTGDIRSREELLGTVIRFLVASSTLAN